MTSHPTHTSLICVCVNMSMKSTVCLWDMLALNLQGVVFICMIPYIHRVLLNLIKVNAKLAAAEEALALSVWTTATICRVLSLESVSTIILA